ncbi:hypothetical protein TruAng_006020 [Truncatella angustata]|nr:hypothetical protein TruAng_006020 [Truncatella angustata]
MSSSAAASSSAPAKKKRKTAAEKEAEEKERAMKKAKRDEEAAEKAKEKEEKEAAKAKEREEKEAVKAVKAAEKAKAIAEKEEKERRKREEEDKKKRAQPTLFGFLKTKPAVLGDVSPNKQSSSSSPPKAVDSSPIRLKAPLTSSVIASPSTTKELGEPKSEKSAYQKMFQEFYIKSDVKMAPTPFQMDDETRLTKSKILDEYIGGQRGDANVKPFDPISTFQFNGLPVPRGKQHLAVKKVMAEIFGDPLDSAPNNRTESQQVRFASVQDQLNSIPVKVLSFWEDVRPPYIGTVTSKPDVKLRKLGRQPNRRLLKLNYEYDSEAEWEEEEGEDLDDEEADDEENDGEEEMDDFLDDAEDVAAARPAFLGDSEPVSTGICYEDRKRLSHNASGEDCATVYKYRMEFLLEPLEHHHSIDPFSSDYWQPKATPGTSCAQSKISSSTKSVKAGMAPPPAPGSSTQAQPDWNTLVPKSLLGDFKRAVVSKDINFLTKVGIVDMLSKTFSSVTKNQVRATLDYVAERSSLPGAKKSAKVWVLRPEHALDKD